MGKKRIVSKGGESGGTARRAAGKSTKKRVASGTLHVQSTYNNTLVTLTDEKGNKLTSSSSGSLGFKGAKKGTPFAAAAIGDVLAESAKKMGMKEVDVIIKGVGSGREAAVRSFAQAGFAIKSIKDTTPVPFNGVKQRKPRRV